MQKLYSSLYHPTKYYLNTRQVLDCYPSTRTIRVPGLPKTSECTSLLRTTGLTIYKGSLLCEVAVVLIIFFQKMKLLLVSLLLFRVNCWLGFGNQVFPGRKKKPFLMNLYHEVFHARDKHIFFCRTKRKY